MPGTGRRGRPPKNPGLRLVEHAVKLEGNIQDIDNKGERELSIDEVIDQKIEEKISMINSEEMFQLIRELDKEISNKINRVNLRYLIHFMESGLNALKELEAVSNKENN